MAGAPTGLSADDFVARAGALAPLIRERAEEGELARHVSPEVIDAIKAGGFYRLMLPARFGGYEVDLPTVIRCSLEWSKADASTAWVAGLTILHQWVIALFPLHAQEDIWGDNPDAITVGSYAPSGICERVDGGFRMSGIWSYASGCNHADWGLMGAMLPPAGEGDPAPGFVILPRSDFTVDDSWDTMGLASTGSHNMICKDAFVPEHRSVTFAQLASGKAPGTEINTSPLFRYPLLSLIAYSISTPAIGCLEGALEHFIAQTKDWTTRGAVVRGGKTVADYQSVQMRVGAAAGALKAAKAMLFEQLEASRRTIMDEGGTLSTDERMDNRLAQAYTIHLAVKGMDELWGAAGGAGIKKSEYLQRAWRDAHAVAHHVSFNWDALTSMYGHIY